VLFVIGGFQLLFYYYVSEFHATGLSSRILESLRAAINAIHGFLPSEMNIWEKDSVPMLHDRLGFLKLVQWLVHRLPFDFVEGKVCETYTKLDVLMRIGLNGNFSPLQSNDSANLLVEASARWLDILNSPSEKQVNGSLAGRDLSWFADYWPVVLDLAATFFHESAKAKRNGVLVAKVYRQMLFGNRLGELISKHPTAEVEDIQLSRRDFEPCVASTLCQLLSDAVRDNPRSVPLMKRYIDTASPHKAREFLLSYPGEREFILSPNRSHNPPIHD